MVAKAHGLGNLQMGEPGHDDFGVGLSHTHEGPLEICQQGQEGFDFITQPKPDICGHLIVSRSACVQPFAGIADQLSEPGFDV
jgi:hypothetical protein